MKKGQDRVETTTSPTTDRGERDTAHVDRELRDRMTHDREVRDRKAHSRGIRDRNARDREARHPVPGVKHEPEPDAENIMPAEHEPGTL